MILGFFSCDYLMKSLFKCSAQVKILLLVLLLLRFKYYFYILGNRLSFFVLNNFFFQRNFRLTTNERKVEISSMLRAPCTHSPSPRSRSLSRMAHLVPRMNLFIVITTQTWGSLSAAAHSWDWTARNSMWPSLCHTRCSRWPKNSVF